MQPGYRTAARLLLAVGGLPACDGSLSTDIAPTLASLVELSGGGQTGIVAEALAEPLAVHAISSTGGPMRGIVIDWAVTEGGGEVDPPSSVTGSDGMATTTWLLGPVAGTQSVRAAAGPAVTVDFDAVAHAAAPHEVKLDPAEVSLDALGATAEFAVTVADRFGNPIETPTVVWSVADVEVASVDGSGRVTAVSNGSSWLRAVVGEAVDSASVTVAQQVTSMRLSAPEDTLREVGASMQVTADARDRLGNPVMDAALEWDSLDPTVVRVDERGRLVAVGPGSTEVVATVGAASGALRVTVFIEPPPTPQTLEIHPAEISIPAGGTARLEGRYRDEDGEIIDGGPISWKSLAPDIASVDDEGNVLGLTPGSTTIEATGAGLGASAKVVVAATSGGTRGTILSGDRQTGPPGAELPLPLVLRVEDEDGNPVAGQLISWVVVEGGGSMYSGVTITDPSGVAQDYWTLGPRRGSHTVEARAVDSTSGVPITFAVFRATAR